MGVYDRDYFHEEPPRSMFGGPRLMVTNLVLINVAIYIVQVVFTHRPGPGGQQIDALIQIFGLHSNVFTHPWQAYQLVTYGFLHDPDQIWHIIGNMVILWFLGRDVEEIYGSREFVTFYLSTIILSGLSWAFLDSLTAANHVPLVGASGGVTGVALVYVMHFPKRIVYLFFTIPLPIWVVAAAFLAYEAIQAVAVTEHDVAHSAHLAGAAFGYLFYRTRWHLGSFIPRGGLKRVLKSRPNVRIHEPPAEDDAQLKAEVDRILEKISRQGEASLTSQERRTLEDASRRYQRRGR